MTREELEQALFGRMLTTRAHNLLKGMGITTLNHLLDTTEEELRKQPEFGPVSVNEIKDILAACGRDGLKLRQPEERATASVRDICPHNWEHRKPTRKLSYLESRLSFVIRCTKCREILRITKRGRDWTVEK